VGTKGFTAYTLREPIGVVGQIIPWVGRRGATLLWH
jgi:acyl-CoA reductase-like NAD-dependent aldehyde dehydrogenase